MRRLVTGMDHLKEILTRPLQRGVETNHDIGRTVFLAGCGRSGTTWLAEIINARHRYRYLFEPFHCHKTPLWVGFEFHQYLAADDDDPAAGKAADAILSGRVHSRWIDAQNRRLVASERLVKDTRTNLILGWLRARYPGLPMLLLTRHPLSVALSRMKLGWGPGMSLADIRRQPALVERHLTDCMDLLEARAGDDLSMQVAHWCIAHRVPLRELADGDYCLVHYEALVAKPRAELTRVFDYLGIPVESAHLKRLDRASWSASRSARRSLDLKALIRPWEGRLDPAAVARAMEMVDAFGLSDFVAELTPPV